MASSSPRDFRQHLEVETPEHVLLDYEIAGVGSRALAAIGGAVLVGLVLISVAWLLGQLFPAGSKWAVVIYSLLGFLIFWGYFTFFEGLREGQTPGKRWVGIRVVRDT